MKGVNAIAAAVTTVITSVCVKEERQENASKHILPSMDGHRGLTLHQT
jgi:hypothetical protein